MQTGETGRLKAAEIFDRVTATGRDELDRQAKNLAFASVAAGLGMGISGLGVAVLQHVLGTGATQEALAYVAYPLGFLVVILGRQQLFTENTLLPVAVVLDQRKRLVTLLRLWAVVLVGNVAGTLLFAALATQTPALPEGVLPALVVLGSAVLEPGLATVFWSAVVAGWIVALVAWLVLASTDTTAQILVILVLTYLVGVGHFAHSIAGSAEALTAVLDGAAPLSRYLAWLAAAVVGNTLGGVTIVALFNYGQVHSDT